MTAMAFLASEALAKIDSRSSRSCKLVIEFSDKRFQSVMNFDAFQAKTKCFQLSSRQRATDFVVGVR